MQPAADYWTVDRETLGMELYYFWRGDKQTPLTENGEIFWMNDKAVAKFGFRRIWRVLQISEGVDLQNSSYPTQRPHSIIAKYENTKIWHLSPRQFQ